MIDLQSDFGVRVAERLRTESVIWLTTVGKDGTPQPRPVWFYWNEQGRTCLIFSQPAGAKVRHIRSNPRVALNFNSDESGDDIVVLIGRAEILDNAPESEMKAYLEKYREGIKSLGYTPERMLAEYSIPIRVLPERLRGF